MRRRIIRASQKASEVYHIIEYSEYHSFLYLGKAKRLHDLLLSN